jgi:LL-H family phage holin
MLADPFVSDLVNTLIVALVPVAIGGVAYLGRGVVAYLRARLTAEHYAMVEKIAATIVASVEQTLASEDGQAKKDAALALVRAECAKRGIRLDEEQIENAIEAAVYRERLLSSSR